MLIKRQAEGSHWYQKTGEPYYEVLKADGSGMRPVNVRDAFKAGAYRSVTNVLSVVAKPALVNWRIEQAVLAALTLPRQPGESDHNFAERVIIDSEKQGKGAADKGTRLHELAADFATKGAMPVDSAEAVLLAPFQAWWAANANAPKLIASERVMLNHSLGYAGRLDLAMTFQDGSIALLDIKTQDVARGAKGDPKPTFYDEWALQLAAYSRGVFADGTWPAPFPWRLLSLVIDRSQPGCYVKEWTNAANPLASSEEMFQVFASACRIWSYLKGGTPGRDAKAA